MASEPEALRIPYQGSVIRTHRRSHLVVMVILMMGHTFAHYAVLVPGVGKLFKDLPYFDLHVLHGAEYLVVVAYASLVFRLRGGVLGLLAMGIASIPFLFAFTISPLQDVEYGFSGPGLGLGLSTRLIELFALLAVGAWFVTVNELWGRERDRRISAQRQVEDSNEALRQANRQLTALNQTIQTQLTRLFGTLKDVTDRELRDVEEVPVSSLRERYKRFIEEIKTALA